MKKNYEAALKAAAYALAVDSGYDTAVHAVEDLLVELRAAYWKCR